MDKNSFRIPFVAIQLTTNCNLDCKFCFRRENFQEVSSESMQSILDKIVILNPTKVVLSGGEPLLRVDIKDILFKLKSNGIRTVLQTNGLLLPNMLNEIDEFVDWYSLSLDGSNSLKNSIMRGPLHFAKTIQSLNLINNLNKPVKIGTVVTKVNSDDVINIGMLLKDKVTVWKLYQFYARKGCEAERNENNFNIEDSLFRTIVSQTKKRYPDINIQTHSVKDFSKGPCVLIHPDGKVHLTEGTEDVEIGNMYEEEIDTIQNRIISSPFFSSIIENYGKTYDEKTK